MCGPSEFWRERDEEHKVRSIAESEPEEEFR